MGTLWQQHMEGKRGRRSDSQSMQALFESVLYTPPEPVKDKKFDSWNPIGLALDVLDTPRSVVYSGIKEIVDGFQGEGFSPGDFLKQYREGYGAGDLLREEVGTTGNKWLDRGIGFAGDVLLDPLTYVGAPGASSLARGGAKVIAQQTAQDAVAQAAALATKRGKGIGSAATKRLEDAQRAIDEAADDASRMAATRNMENTQKILREKLSASGELGDIDKAMYELGRRGGGAAAIRDTDIVEVLVGQNTSGLRLRPFWRSSGGPQLMSQERWSDLTKPIRELRGSLASTKTFDKLSSRFYSPKTQALRKLIDEYGKQSPEVAGKALRAQGMDDVAQKTLLAERAAFDIRIMKSAEALGENPGVLDAVRVLMQTPTNQWDERVDEMTRLRNAGVVDQVYELRSQLSNIREWAVSKGLRVGDLGETYLPIRQLDRSADPTTARGIRLESNGEVVPSIAKFVEANPKALRKDGTVKLTKNFDWATYVDEVEAIAKRQLGDDWVELFEKNPVELVRRYLNEISSRVRVREFQNILDETGLGVWSKGYKDAIDLEDLLARLGKRGDKLKDAGRILASLESAEAELVARLRASNMADPDRVELIREAAQLVMMRFAVVRQIEELSAVLDSSGIGELRVIGEQLRKIATTTRERGKPLQRVVERNQRLLDNLARDAAPIADLDDAADSARFLQDMSAGAVDRAGRLSDEAVDKAKLADTDARAAVKKLAAERRAMEREFEKKLRPLRNELKTLKRRQRRIQDDIDTLQTRKDAANQIVQAQQKLDDIAERVVRVSNEIAEITAQRDAEIARLTNTADSAVPITDPLDKRFMEDQLDSVRQQVADQELDALQISRAQELDRLQGGVEATAEGLEAVARQASFDTELADELRRALDEYDSINARVKAIPEPDDNDLKAIRQQFVDEADAQFKTVQGELINLVGSFGRVEANGNVVVFMSPTRMGEWDWWRQLPTNRRRGLTLQYLRKGDPSFNVDQVAAGVGMDVEEWAERWLSGINALEEARKARTQAKRTSKTALTERYLEQARDEVERYAPNLRQYGIFNEDDVRQVVQRLDELQGTDALKATEENLSRLLSDGMLPVDSKQAAARRAIADAQEIAPRQAVIADDIATARGVTDELADATATLGRRNPAKVDEMLQRALSQADETASAIDQTRRQTKSAVTARSKARREFDYLEQELGAWARTAETEKAVALSTRQKARVDLGRLRAEYDKLPNKTSEQAELLAERIELYETINQLGGALDELGAGMAAGAREKFEALTNILMNSADREADLIKLTKVRSKISTKKGDIAKKEMQFDVLKRRTQQAAENKKVIDFLVRESGMKLREFRGMMMPEELAEAMALTTKFHELPEFVKQWDQLSYWWKGYATLSPGFHVRNAYSASFNNWMAGVPMNTQKRFAAEYYRYVKGQATKDPEIRETIELLINRGIIGQLGQYDEEVRLIGKAGQSLNPAAGIKDPNKQFVGVAKSRAMGSHVEAAVRGALAHHVMSTMPKSSMNARLAAASAAIDKFHFNYADLSQFERNVRRFVPFWTWMSRNVPLQLELLGKNPQKILAAERLLENISDGQPDNPFVPDWIRENEYAAIGGTMFLTPELPFISLKRESSKLGDPLDFMQSVNPFIKGPVELATGHDMFRGYELKDKDRVLRPVENMFPLFMRARRLLPTEDKYQERWLSSLASFLGVPVKELTKGEMLAEMRRQSYDQPLNNELEAKQRSERARQVQEQELMAALRRAGIAA
jgi:hypothetical protein